MENDEIPYQDKMFDCITIINALHHYQKPVKILKEVNRVLKDNGILIIADHDIWTSYDETLVRVLHSIYSFLEDKEEEYARYYNFIELDILMKRAGFRFLNGFNFDYTRVKEINITNDSVHLYIKNKKK